MSAHTEALKQARAALFSIDRQDGDEGFLSPSGLSALRAAVASIEAALSLPDPSAAPVVPQWLPIESAPKDGRKMLLTYTNSNGNRRTVVGGWVTDEEAAETDADGVGLEAGWYERIDNWGEYYQVAIHEGEPTHWMPLPPAPQQGEQG